MIDVIKKIVKTMDKIYMMEKFNRELVQSSGYSRTEKYVISC
jgi:hypothetical protein